MNKKTFLAIAIACVVSAPALADPTNSCANPLPITSQAGTNGIVTGNTCDFLNTLPTYGGTASPQREAIFSFVANDANATLVMTEPGAPYGGAMFLMPSPCSVATDPINLGGPGFDMTIAPGSLVNGQTYYVIVTTDPSLGPDICGEFNVAVTGVLPVELESFEVE